MKTEGYATGGYGEQQQERKFVTVTQDVDVLNDHHHSRSSQQPEHSKEKHSFPSSMLFMGYIYVANKQAFWRSIECGVELPEMVNDFLVQVRQDHRVVGANFYYVRYFPNQKL